RTARAKGVGEPWVLGKHALRNAFIPILTLLGLQSGQLMGGAVLTETVFAWPGLGRLMVKAIFARDYVLLQGAVLVFALAFVVMLALSAALAPWLAPLDPTRQTLIEKRARPGGKYLLGADEFGRDIFSRVIYGSRVALLVSVLSMLIALVGGLLLGTLAGFTGGWLGAVLMRGVEILLAFPYLLLALALVAMLGPGVLNPTIAVGIWR